MGAGRADVDAFFAEYAAALAGALTTGTAEAATSYYGFPALAVRDEASWAYDDADALVRDLDALRQQAEAAGVVDIAVDVTTVEPLTQALTTVDADWDFTDADGAIILEQGWRYVVQRTSAGPRIRFVAARTRAGD
ncbi:MAG: hypothetical protein R3290_06165 [Acidimicrobiia bacterium]|nr:hypothetical protein [Acidimicrobiia bacterium]